MAAYLIAFESTHAAMAANKALASVASVAPHMIPTPRDITASCGMSLRFEAEDDAAAVSLATSVQEVHEAATLYSADSAAPGKTWVPLCAL